MDLDFKDRTFSFLSLKKKKLKRRIFFLSFFFLICILFLVFIDQTALKNIRKGEDLILSGNFEECRTLLKKGGTRFFRRSSFYELNGILNLILNNRQAGEEFLKKGNPGRSSVRSGMILAFLSDNCLYGPLDAYSSLLPGDDDTVSFFRIVSDTSLYRPDESEKKIREFSPEDQNKYSRNLTRLKEINQKVKGGRIEFIFDRDGEPLAAFDPGSGKSKSLVPGIYFTGFDNELQKGLKFVKLSIDKDVQIKLHDLFKKNSGSFLLTDLEDGSIIASYSKPYSGENKNSALTNEYEPGSVIKLLTLFAYLNSTGEKIFPFDCKGFTTYEMKIFYDWMKHGTLNSQEKALARSCNLAFAEMGILSGRERIKDVLENFLFNRAPLNDGIFQFDFGRFNFGKAGRRDIANLSIGLEHISITTVHLAILSSIIAQNGNIIFPYFTISNKNVFGLGYYNHSPVYNKIFINNKYFEDVKAGMREVTMDPEGTGRRAAVEFMDIGLKTGTAGRKSEGFDSVLTGFFPFEKPKYAFAFRLEHGGKAEYNGALFLRKFLKAFYGKK